MMHRALLAAAFAAALAGCAATPATDPPQEEALAERLERLERDVAELRAQLASMQPGVDRFVRIEGDIRDLLAQLSALPGTVSPGAAPPAGPDPLDPTRAVGGHALHLASYREPKQVGDGWRRLLARFPDQLGTLAPRVVGIDFGDGRGTFYRLKAGPLPDAASAEALCRLIRSSGEFCDATDFTGTPGEEFWGRP
ncbi:SPOR domain-containing protein [Arenibaculum sp.]|uniref:SPOR domain-containing protein n=1 Tax=Arenibaculum sp. TaxID=2865862 RepID=UPI002E11DF14|nr:SPOR domain-containing protein [Arenibaculum sp.]